MAHHGANEFEKALYQRFSLAHSEPDTLNNKKGEDNMDNKSFQFEKILNGYLKNDSIEDDRFLFLKIAEALHQLVDFEKAKTAFAISQADYENYIQELKEAENGEASCLGVVDQIEEDWMVKVYDIQELTIFGEPHLKLLCYDATAAEF